MTGDYAAFANGLAQQDAEFIVLAVNTLPSLYSALEGLLMRIDADALTDDRYNDDTDDAANRAAIEAARAALKLARGEQS